jgi:phosphoribosylformylglycinamidine synthase
MALNAIDECVRNLVCVGADPDHIAILDNFCWPSCNKPENLGALVRACEGCYDGAKAYRTPFISGKDSLNNQFTTEAGRTIEIPYTLLITGVGEVPDVGRCVTSDIKRAGSRIILVESIETDEPLGARVSAARTVAKAIAGGAVLSAHDVSDGGVLCALAEMLIGGQTDDSPIGARLELPEQIDPFAERPGRYLLEIAADGELSAPADVALHELGRTNDSARLVVEGADVDLPITDLERAWRATLDW